MKLSRRSLLKTSLLAIAGACCAALGLRQKPTQEIQSKNPNDRSILEYWVASKPCGCVACYFPAIRNKSEASYRGLSLQDGYTLVDPVPEYLSVAQHMRNEGYKVDYVPWTPWHYRSGCSKCGRVNDYVKEPLAEAFYKGRSIPGGIIDVDTTWPHRDPNYRKLVNNITGEKFFVKYTVPYTPLGA